MRTWIYAFVILLGVSVWLLALRYINDAFLALDFELAIVYLPTAIAGIVVLLSLMRSRRQ